MTPARRAALASFALVAVAVCVLRAPAVRVDILNEDEALYATTAAGMAEGAPPYRAGVESKPPGIFYLYEAGFVVVGRYDMRALHALTTLWVLATALCVGALARRALPIPELAVATPPETKRPKRDKGKKGKKPKAQAPPPAEPAGWRAHLTAPVIAALLYAGFVIVQEPAVLATQCELLYSLPLAGAALLVIRGTRSIHPHSPSGVLRAAAPQRSLRATGLLALVAAGLLIGAGTLIKPTAVSLLVATSGWLFLRRAFLRGPDRWLVDLVRIAALLVGFAGAWLLAAAYFSHLGVWDDLVYWAFRWTLGTYIPTGTSHSPWLVRFIGGFCTWFVLLAILWVLGVRALRTTARAQLATRVPDAPDAPAQVVWLLSAWTATALAFTFLGGRFFDHYFPAVLPPLAALAAAGFTLVRADARWRRALLTFSLVPITACWLGAWQFATTMRWLGDDRKPYDAIAAYAREHTAPTDRLFVWGYYPLIYVAADRLSATRFVGCHYLTGYAAIGLGQDLPPAIEDRLGVPDGFHTLLSDLQENRPALVIDTSPGDLHHWKRYPLSRYAALASYVSANYHVETEIQGAVIYRRNPDAPP